jgi:hypothetical protein
MEGISQMEFPYVTVLYFSSCLRCFEETNSDSELLSKLNECENEMVLFQTKHVTFIEYYSLICSIPQMQSITKKTEFSKPKLF